MSTKITYTRTDGTKSKSLEVDEDILSETHVKSAIDQFSSDDLRTLCNNMSPLYDELSTVGSASISDWTGSLHSTRTFDAPDSDTFSISVNGVTYVDNI